jgi:hypothetical protein
MNGKTLFFGRAFGLVALRFYAALDETSSKRHTGQTFACTPSKSDSDSDTSNSSMKYVTCVRLRFE